jgi:FixJ family two-component response regulator
MPGPSGLELQDALKRLGIGLPVVFLTGHGDLPTGVRAMKAGAVDFLTKPVEREALLAAIAKALEVDGAQRAARDAASELQSRFAQLTPREREVFERIVAGRLNKQIAGELGIAERTVKSQRAQVMVKLGAANAAELGRIAALLHERTS